MRKNSLTLKQQELERLIAAQESVRVEFKERLNESTRGPIREAVCAFANDLQGSGRPGIVVVGLTDKGTPTGASISDEVLRNLTDIKTDGNILPPPTLLAEKRSYQGSDIAVVTVHPSDSPPVRYKGVIQVRSGPRKGRATAQDERILNERRRHRNRPFDATPLSGTGKASLNALQFEQEYLPRLVDREVLLTNDRTESERLAAAKMIACADEDVATVLGLMVIGARPRDYIPGAYVQFLRIAGRDLSHEITDEAEIDGTISDILLRLDDKLRSHNRSRIDLLSNDLEQRAESYPIAALQQLVRNAVMHRDYETSNAPVRVTWFDDRVEVQNPGGPFGTVTEENFGQPGFTDYRNPNLAESMKVLGYVQRFGVGIPTAKRLLKEAGHADIEFTTSATHVLVTVKAVQGRHGAS